MSNSDLIGATEAARRCGLTRRGFLFAIERGDVKARRIVGGRGNYVLEEEEVERYAAKRRADRDRRKHAA